MLDYLRCFINSTLAFLSLLLVVLMQLPASVVLADGSGSFSNFTPSDGLVHKTVNCMVQDRDGFLWVGTSNGISRFDGYSFRNFKHDGTSLHSLRGTSVFGIVEAIDGSLWLSSDIGIEHFDKNTEAFSLPRVADIAHKTFDKNIRIDQKGFMWVYSSTTHFVVFDPLSRETILRIDSIPGISISSIYQFIVRGNTLWMACKEGIVAYNIDDKSLTFLEKGNVQYCFSARMVGENSIVMSFMHRGVFVIDMAMQRGSWVRQEVIEKNIGTKTIIYDANLGPDGTLWVGLASGMVGIAGGSTKYYNYNSQDHFFDGDLVWCVFKDANNNMLFGSVENGFYIKRRYADYFKLATRLYKDELKKTEITSFEVFDDRSLLYSNVNGLFCCNDFKDMPRACAKRINNMASASIYPVDGRTCLVNNADSIYSYDSHTRRLTWLMNSHAASIALRDKNDVLWVGSWVGTITGYDRRNKKTYKLLAGSAGQKKNPVLSLHADSDGSLWVGTVSGGLIHIINPTAEQPTREHFSVDSSKHNSISSNIIQCITPDASGNLWIGTNGGGVSKLNKRTRKFYNFSHDNGLKSNNIESLLIDAGGNVWIASNVLTKYDTTMKTFTHYSETDGVETSFIWKGARKSTGGMLLFANKKGIVLFDPGRLPERPVAATPVLTGIRVRGITLNVGDSIDGEVPYVNNINYSGELSLPYRFNYFAIEFASIGFDESENISYEYMLEGIDKGWVPADNKNRLASYSALQPGSYLFKVRASNGAAGWSKARTLTIGIVPPWWKTWWFKVLFTLALVAAVMLVFINRTQRLHRQNERLEKTVEERTRELKEANDALRGTAMALDQKNKILEEKQMAIEMKNADLLEALGTKDRLISVLGHDFKNPMAGLQGVSVLMVKECEKHGTEKLKKYADVFYKTSSSLLDQMVTVLDWAQSQLNNMQFRPEEVDLGFLLNDTINLLEENARQKNISVSTQLEYNAKALTDPRMMSTVLRNLLGNAIKFTPNGGKILVQLQEYENGINIAFIDTGVGMSPDVVRAITEGIFPVRSSYGTGKEKGSGLGLQLCKSFVERNGGTFALSSTPGSGSVFTVSLPKGQTLAVRSASYTVDNDDIRPRSQHTILVIDDDDSMAEVLRGTFDDEYNVVVSSDGREGLYLAQNILPSVIISDIGLPGIDGIELCETLKKNEFTSHIPVLLISSMNDHDTQNRAFLGGSDDFIAKPFNMFALKQKVKNLVGMGERLSQNNIQNADPSRAFLLPEDFESKIVKKTLAFIHENLSEPDLDTNTIADRIGISRTQLWRVFKSATGKSLGDVIRDTRMQKAMEMLKTGRYRVNEVAYEVGYSNPRHLTRNFTKAFGRSPSSCLGETDMEA